MEFIMEATQFTVAMVLKEVLCTWNKQEVFHVGDVMA